MIKSIYTMIFAILASAQALASSTGAAGDGAVRGLSQGVYSYYVAMDQETVRWQSGHVWTHYPGMPPVLRATAMTAIYLVVTESDGAPAAHRLSPAEGLLTLSDGQVLARSDINRYHETLRRIDAGEDVMCGLRRCTADDVERPYKSWVRSLQIDLISGTSLVQSAADLESSNADVATPRDLAARDGNFVKRF